MRFWLLTDREYAALRMFHLRAHGYKGPLNSEEAQNLSANEKRIRDAWVKARARVEEKKLAARAERIKLRG